MQTLSVLLTNNTLSHFGGTERYLRDVAVTLLRRGHRPVAYSVLTGPVAEDLRQATVPVIDDITRLAEPPDVIHGHHHIETLIAACAFPGVPIVHFCHGWVPWEEMPLRHPAIRRYVAVDEVCLDRLVREEGIPAERVDLVLNFVDLARFQPRAPLPSRPARALVFSNLATHDGYVRTIAAACEAANISLDVVGGSVGNASAAPETVLPEYDVVFAKARSALEAMAVGCAVVLADAAGCGPLVTPALFDRLRKHNFGIRELQHPHDVAWYADQIADYSAHDAAVIRDRVRAEADLESAVDRLLAIYDAAMHTEMSAGDPQAAAAAHLQRIAPAFKRRAALAASVDALTRELAAMRHDRDRLTTEYEALTTRARAYEADLTARIRQLEETLVSRQRAFGS
jgi:glycosyltransferase involved in cell wall biosynthesis